MTLKKFVMGLAFLPWASIYAASLCQEPSPDTPLPQIAFEEIARGLEKPTHIADDGRGRLFVVEQAGTIRIVENGRVLSEPFLDIRDRVVDSQGERGLFSIAFDPRYQDNGVFYVDYTSSLGKLHSRISRFKRRDANHADPQSETVLLKIDQPYNNHNGGQLAFGPDGYLYIGMGDGGSANDPHGNGQNPAVLLGKLLRIDVSHETGSQRYAIPRDNPFAGKSKFRPEIWAYGLRNPWRYSFDAANGRLYLADVGQDLVEEIDVIEKGGNYGWNIIEGDICTPGVNPSCDKTGLKMPIHTYRHPAGFSITGGFVYRGNAIPGLCGTYLYADYVTRKVWGLRYDGNKTTINTELIGPNLTEKVIRKLRGSPPLPHISSFGEDRNHELYVTDHQTGTILKIVLR
jgi:glucose/arabinose dehydrogenase